MRLIRDKLAGEVVGFGRDANRLRRCVELGAVHRVTTEITESAIDADLVIACTPVQEIVGHLVEASGKLSVNGLMTDVGSTKRTIVEAMSRTPAGRCFVGSHPLAGSDRSGVVNANPNLLIGKLVFLTPTAENRDEDIERLEGFWKSLGAETKKISPDDHDRIMSLTSHLPHAVAAMMASLTPHSLLDFVGTGWSDTTRIAGGDPVLWRQILEENREHVLQAMKSFATISHAWIEALEAGDFDQVEQLLKTGKDIRDAVGNRYTSD
jgi:prephenate dehydrogenase